MEVFAEYICPICEKTFIPAPLHRYKIEDKNSNPHFVCSYKCMRIVQNGGGGKQWKRGKFKHVVRKANGGGNSVL